MTDVLSFPATNAKVGEKGIYFYSRGRHCLIIDDAKFLQISNNVYIKKNRLICLTNVSNVERIGDKLYFNACGYSGLLIDLKNVYRYFNIAIDSKNFDLKKNREMAIQEMLTNPFGFEDNEDFERYLWIIETVFNIHIYNDKIKVGQNKYRLPYVLSYKTNNVTKRVYVNTKK